MTDFESPPPWQESPRSLLNFACETRPDWDRGEAWQAIHAAHSAGMPWDRIAKRLVSIAFRHKPGEPPSSPLELRDEVRAVPHQAAHGSLDSGVKAALFAELADAGQAIRSGAKTGGQPVLDAKNDPRAGAVPATETK